MRTKPRAVHTQVEPAASGTYVTFTASVPTANPPPGIKMFALPFTKVTGEDVYPPDCSVTEPVGVGLPPPPTTVAVSVTGCVDATVGNCGVTVTAGSVNAVDVTVTVFWPILPA